MWAPYVSDDKCVRCRVADYSEGFLDFGLLDGDPLAADADTYTKPPSDSGENPVDLLSFFGPTGYGRDDERSGELLTKEFGTGCLCL